MKNKILNSLTLATFMFVFAACGSTSQNRSMRPVLRAAVDAPVMFEAPAGVTMGETSCVSPLKDPRNGTTINMVTSFGSGVGDYQAPAGLYGLAEGELLRINCSTGEVLGIVKR